MGDRASASSEAANRIGGHLKGGFRNYVEHWQEWIVPVLVSAIAILASLACCLLPYFIVIGPMTCGLYSCALHALQGRPVVAAQLQRGWETAAGSILSSLFIMIGSMLPFFMIMGGFVVYVLSIRTVAAHSEGQPIEVVAHEENGDAPIAPVNDEVPDGLPENGGHRPTSEPSPLLLISTLLGALTFYAIMFGMMLLFLLWQLWFMTRTMFVMPLIADRGLGVVEAVRQSWNATRGRFWELLVINLAAYMIFAIGMYAMYVGLLFTTPLALTVLASVYREHFGGVAPDLQPQRDVEATS